MEDAHFFHLSPLDFLRFPMYLFVSSVARRLPLLPLSPLLTECLSVRFPLIVGLLNDYPVIDDISNSLSGFGGGDFSNCSQSGAGIVSRYPSEVNETSLHPSPQKYMLS